MNKLALVGLFEGQMPNAKKADDSAYFFMVRGSPRLAPSLLRPCSSSRRNCTLRGSSLRLQGGSGDGNKYCLFFRIDCLLLAGAESARNGGRKQGNFGEEGFRNRKEFELLPTPESFSLVPLPFPPKEEEGGFIVPDSSNHLIKSMLGFSIETQLLPSFSLI